MSHIMQGFLKEFSKMNFSDFCLAHVFTYRDFPAGIQGLAYRGTLCEPPANTGFTTLLNHGVCSMNRQNNSRIFCSNSRIFLATFCSNLSQSRCTTTSST